MGTPRRVPLFDAAADPPSWNERMAPGEFAVHYSSFAASAVEPYCTVTDGLPAAETYAREVVAREPAVRCRIYSHEGFTGAPVREIQGQRYAGEREITPRFRRWGGSLLFFGGLLLVAIDWAADFRLSWPAVLGSRLLIPGLVLLATEGLVLLHAKQKRTQAKDQAPL